MTMYFWTVYYIQEITQCLPTDDYLTISKLLDIVNNTIYNFTSLFLELIF